MVEKYIRKLREILYFWYEPDFNYDIFQWSYAIFENEVDYLKSIEVYVFY